MLYYTGIAYAKMDSLCNVYVLLLAVKQADGCEPRHVRCDRKRKRSFSGLSSFGLLLPFFC